MTDKHPERAARLRAAIRAARKAAKPLKNRPVTRTGSARSFFCGPLKGTPVTPARQEG